MPQSDAFHQAMQQIQDVFAALEVAALRFSLDKALEHDSHSEWREMNDDRDGASGDHRILPAPTG